ncbi:MAG: hypothetical protein JST54_15340 [Deltaproteobacteria bacterium]|nr:hypothetical protein [Deltaproteobacteria bacterium]
MVRSSPALLCLSAATLVALLGCPKSPPPNPLEGWTTEAVKEAGFQASFPEQPTRTEIPSGGQPAHLVKAKKDGVEYSVMAMAPATDKEALIQLNALFDGIAGQLEKAGGQGTDVTVNGKRARRIESKIGDDLSLLLLVNGNDRLYVVAAHGRRGSGSFQDATAQAFLDSFRVIPVEATPAALELPPVLWKDFSPAGAGFKVRMPGNPPPLESSADGMNIKTYAVDAPNGRFAVDVMQLKDGRAMPEGALDQLIETTTKRVPATSTGSHGPRFSLDGAPANDLLFVGTSGPSRLAIRLVQAKDRIFKVSVLTSQAKESAEEKAFLTSFHLEGHP